MEGFEFKQIFKIDYERLYNYYERINNQFNDLPHIQIVAKFLINQSIGSSFEEVLAILDYFQNKLTENKNILDFAFEWIKANKVRLEYKKYIHKTNYINDELAVDDCIFLFFLPYDKFMRKILSKDIKEYEISTLYELFFSPSGAEHLDIHKILDTHKSKVPTLFRESQRLNTNIYTLRSGLISIIVKDYEEKQSKEIKISEQAPIKLEALEFNGSALERMLKTYCFNKAEIATKDIENDITLFLSSYFKLGKFYKYDEFEEQLINSLAEFLFSGLSEKIKQDYSLNSLKNQISEIMRKFREISSIHELDGLAWINDLKQVLKKIVREFVDSLFNPNKDTSFSEIIPIKSLITAKEETDFSAIFDLNLEIEEYRKNLEQLLKQSNLGFLEKQQVIRAKVQAFQTEKKKLLLLK